MPGSAVWLQFPARSGASSQQIHSREMRAEVQASLNPAPLHTQLSSRWRKPGDCRTPQPSVIPLPALWPSSAGCSSPPQPQAPFQTSPVAEQGLFRQPGRQWRKASLLPACLPAGFIPKFREAFRLPLPPWSGNTAWCPGPLGAACAADSRAPS